MNWEGSGDRLGTGPDRSGHQRGKSTPPISLGIDAAAVRRAQNADIGRIQIAPCKVSETA